MNDEKLVAICRHELRLKEDKDIARLIREVKIVQDDSSDTYSRLTRKHRVNAREILSGFMLAWEYVEDLDGSGPGQRFWKGIPRPDGLIWPENKKKWIVAGVEKIFNELQDYSIIDRQKRKSRLTSKTYKQADAEGDPSQPGARSMIRPATEEGRRMDKQPKHDVAPVPYHAGLYTMSEQNDTAREDTLEVEGHDHGVPQTPRAASRKANSTTDIVSAENLRDIEVPATMAREYVIGSRQPSPKKKHRAPTPSVCGDISLLLEEIRKIIDRLTKENWDLKLKNSFLENALSRRSDEGVEATIFETKNTKLAEQASSQKKKAKKEAYNKSHDAELDAQLKASATDESTEESPSEKRALTPPYIPEKGLHQTWPAFGFKSVSHEGIRALRGRAVQIDDYEKSSSESTATMPRGRRNSRVKANRKRGLAKKYSSTVPAESGDEGHIDTQEPTPTPKGRLPSLPNPPVIRRRACRKVIHSDSSATEDDSADR